MELQSIQITIAERKYPLKIALKDEQKIRAAANLINEKIGYYRNKYSANDLQDAMSMALLQLVVRLIEAEQKEKSDQILAELSSLDRLLDEYLQSSDTLAL